MVDALRQILQKKAMKEVDAIISFDALIVPILRLQVFFLHFTKKNCITPSQYFDYKRELESQYFALNTCERIFRLALLLK